MQVGYVVMSCASEVTSALKLSSLRSPLPCPTAPVGLTLWTNQYAANRPAITALDSSIIMAMEKHDLRVEADKEKRRMAAVPDDEGWTTVTSRGNKRKVTHTLTTARASHLSEVYFLNHYDFYL